MTGRRASDWLRSLPRSNADESAAFGDRRASDRRSGDRRAPKRPIDPRFAATLLNQILPAAETEAAYPARKAAPRTGIVVNVRV